MEIVYNPILIGLSVVVAIFASYVALNLAYSVTQAKGKVQLIWLGSGALAMGVGIWSMHFVGMLAFEMPGMEMGYDIPLMVLSIGVAIFGGGLALFVVSRPVVKRNSIIVGGLVMAAAICGMHYIGMYSMRMAARIEWNYYLVTLSVVIAVVASFVALLILIELRNKPDKIGLLVLASLLLGLAICGMHYTGMVAATFVHDHTIQMDPSNLLVTSGLTITTILTTVLILALALAGSVAQRIIILRQKRSDEILGTSEEKFRVLVKAVKDYGIFMVDPKGVITTWNAGAKIITGYSDEEIIGKPVSTLYPPQSLATDEMTSEMLKAETQGHYEAELIRRRKDGSTFWAHVVVDPLFDSDGKLTGFSQVVRDITQFKEANLELEKRVKERTLALQESEMQLRTITNAIPVLVAQLDHQEKFLFANSSFCNWFLCPQHEIASKTFSDALGPHLYPTSKSYINRVLAGESVTYERPCLSRDRRAVLNFTFVPERDRGGAIKGFVVVATDVTSYKRVGAV